MTIHTITASSQQSIARHCLAIAFEAGNITLKYHRTGTDTLEKDDGSPVTRADREAETHVLARLKEIAPHIPVVGEESVEAGCIPDISSGTFFLVDPLDGTREFVAGGDSYSVNIALLENFRPIVGVIHVPAKGQSFFSDGDNAYELINGTEHKITARQAPVAGLTVIHSKRHDRKEELDTLLKDHTVAERISCSSAVKFCLIAKGEADLYPRLGPTSEWDTAAGEAILHTAGGRVTQMDGRPLVYGGTDRKFLNPPFIACGAA
ncbi:MAG: 3'(2'),5'-bisphosphate nucleotidase CysQ [Alphaproteobacteria bacterium]|nr:3'(2'),5'-bisphosphate nucleotidase CysQ [Alphaproteobacteria bacterium]